MLFRSFRATALGLLVFVGAALQPAISQASSPFLTIPDAGVVESTAAYRYANMTNDEALAELNRRGLPYVSVPDPVAGVRAPIRLTGRLHGVLIHSGLAPNQRASSPFEILDARLALALDDFTAILEKHDIDEIEHFSMYRPNVVRSPEKPKPTAVAAAPKDKPSGQSTTEKPVPSAAKPTAEKIVPKAEKPAQGKTVPAKVATRGKTTSPRVTNKAPTKTHGIQKPAAKAAPVKKTNAPSAEKPAQKPQPNLGKAGLGAKTPPLEAKGQKQKDPAENVETVSSDKQAEVVTAPQTTRADTTAAPPGTRHPGGLAIDVGKMRKKDGTWINVLTHFHGKIGDKACGADAPVPESAEAKELRALVCDAMDKHIFTYVLTPNYNAAHADHFHMEIKPGVKWFMVH
jgi:Extensin-like protein C-terminus